MVSGSLVADFFYKIASSKHLQTLFLLMLTKFNEEYTKLETIEIVCYWFKYLANLKELFALRKKNQPILYLVCYLNFPLQILYARKLQQTSIRYTKQLKPFSKMNKDRRAYDMAVYVLVSVILYFSKTLGCFRFSIHNYFLK